MSVLLNSWKDIAAYLGIGVRTAQRWEALYGMPVHRIRSIRGRCFAFAKELDEWLERTPVRTEIAASTISKSSRALVARRPTILIVDDNEAHLYALHRILTAAGFQVLSARTGSEAIKKSFDFLPIAVLLDVRLPDLDGFEVCRQLKSDTKSAVIPVIFHTAVGDSYEVREQARAVGAAAILSYPMNHQTVMAMIKASIAPSLWPAEIDRFNFDTNSRPQ